MMWIRVKVAPAADVRSSISKVLLKMSSKVICNNEKEINENSGGSASGFGITTLTIPLRSAVVTA